MASEVAMLCHVDEVYSGLDGVGASGALHGDDRAARLFCEVVVGNVWRGATEDDFGLVVSSEDAGDT